MTSSKKPAAPPATRQRILKIATEEFANRGFAGARIETIMRRSKVSKNLIYHYFKSKEQLFQSVLEADYEKIRFDRVHWPVEGQDPVQNIRDLVGLIFEHWRMSNQFIKLLASENFSKGKHIRKMDRIKEEYARRIERIEAVLAEGVRTGRIRPGIDAAELYVSISALIYHRISNRYTLSFLLDRNYENAESLEACRRHVEQIVMAYIDPQTGPAPVPAAAPEPAQGAAGA
jgi:TetR/AcrR family transcriptional regulator